MPDTWVLSGGRVVTPTGVRAPAAVQVTGSRITAVRDGPARELGGDRIDLDGLWVVPGFVDEHVHGGGGGDFGTEDGDSHARALRFHAEHGTTSMLPTTASAQPQALLDVVEVLAGAVGSTAHGARAVGLHLEGPWLAPEMRGAHATEDLRDPDAAELDRLQEASGGAIRLVTVAAELTGAPDFIRSARSRGVQVNVGHTAATFEQVVAAVEAGATGFTHVYNAMSGLHHRAPGTVGAAMTLDGVLCELILDLVHVAPPAAQALWRTTGPNRLALITDAVTAAGLDDGSYRFGERDIEVRQGQVRIAGTDTIAGSSLALDGAVRNAVDVFGIDVAEASRLASGNVARRLGLDDRLGAISEGLLADVVVLDDQLSVEATVVGGRGVFASESLGSELPGS